jgi:ankyrin repeat protein
VHAQNNLGETPLHKAIFNNSVRLLMVNLLIKAGSNVNKGNDYGETALHYAVRLGREDLVSILLKAGADVNAAGGKEPKVTSYPLLVIYPAID